MKNKKGNKLSKKANGMRLEISFATTKATKKFYRKSKEELKEEEFPVGSKFSYKRKGKKVIFKGNSILVMDMLGDFMDD